MNARAPLRVGIIGTGFGQHVLAPAVRADPRAYLVSIASSSRERALSVAGRLEIPEAYGGWQDLLAESAIDAICIAVPPVLQPEIAESAASLRKHVFCEKPLAVDVAAAERVLTAARSAGVAHAMDFEFREVPVWQEVKRILSKGTIGRVQHVALCWRVETRAHRAKTGGWKLKAGDGGGALNQFASHSLDYLEWLFGRIRRVRAHLGPEGASADARVEAWIDVADGLPITMSIATDAFLGCGHRLEIYGQQGTVVLENRTSDYVSGFTLSVGTRLEGTLRQIMRSGLEDDDGRVGAVGRVFHQFVDAILEGRDAQPNLENGVRVQHLLALFHEAQRLGSWQNSIS